MDELLKRSPHFGQHLAHSAKKTFNFAGWEMPEHFSNLEEEVAACRSAAVLFDGHAMGEIFIRGKDAHHAVQRLCANNILPEPGRCFYTSLLNDRGGILDDLVVLCIAPDHYLLTIAAFNLHKTPNWILQRTADLNICVADHSSGVTCLEVQGPRSREILAGLVDADISNGALPYFGFLKAKIRGIECIVARLGVTGELGYEIFYDPGYAWTMYDLLVAAGDECGMKLCGNRTVGMFRLEKVYHVYTREIDESINPFEAGLERWIKFDKGDFIGREALLKIREDGVKRRLIGFELDGDQATIAPQTTLHMNGNPIGKMTFGAYSPTLRKTIGLAYLPIEMSAIGTRISVPVGTNATNATIVETPFYDRKGARLRL